MFDSLDERMKRDDSVETSRQERLVNQRMFLTKRALLAMEVKHRPSIRPLLEVCGLDLVLASSCEEASRHLRCDRSLRIVFSGVAFPDGSWLQLLHQTVLIRPRAVLFVCSDSELNNRHLPPHVFTYGAHGLVTTPYDQPQIWTILRAVRLARKGELNGGLEILPNLQLRGGPLRSGGEGRPEVSGAEDPCPMPEAAGA